MFSRQVSKLWTNVISKRSLHTSLRKCKEYENPFLRALRIAREDFTRIQPESFNDIEKKSALMGLFPRHADVLIIGGGAVGSSIAYWLKEKTSREGIRVVVIEKDLKCSKSSTTLSMGGMHQQFSLPENIQMSVYGAEFIRTLKKRFGPHADVHFTPQGYLVLADEEGGQTLLDQCVIQREFGCINQILSKDQLRQKFPWINVSDVELGSLGLEREGWFDPWSLLTILRYGAQDMGTHYVEADVVDFTFREREDYVAEGMDDTYEALQEVVIKMSNGEHRTIEFAYCIIAAGTGSAEIAELAKIGTGTGMLSVPLPIKNRNKYLYRFECPTSPPGINTPMTVDYSGLHFRRAGLGGAFLSGFSPYDDPETPINDYFEETVAPILKKRVPSFESMKLTNSWCGLYEHNCYDDSGIIGPHPYYHNLYLATGFSGHGIQQAPAVGRAVAELILDGNFKTIDLTRFGFDRFIVNKPMYELAMN